MDNLINVQVAIRQLKKKLDKDAKGDIASFYNKIIENVITTLSEIPTIDAVPVVRCKDCAHNNLPPTAGNALCSIYYGMTEGYGFCHKGERREE